MANDSSDNNLGMIGLIGAGLAALVLAFLGANAAGSNNGSKPSATTTMTDFSAPKKFVFILILSNLTILSIFFRYSFMD